MRRDDDAYLLDMLLAAREAVALAYHFETRCMGFKMPASPVDA